MSEDSCADICQNDESLDDKLSCICHELELALKWKRPSILFAIYDNENVLHFAQDSLEALVNQANQKVVHYQVETQKQIDLIKFVRDISEKNKEVVFIHSSNSVENNTETGNLISIVNSCRGFLIDNLVRVVFWLSENEALKVAHLAPDFWASRHRVFEFFNVQANGQNSPMKRVFLTQKALVEHPIDASMLLDSTDLQIESPLVIDFSEEEEPTFSGINLLLMMGVANWKEGNQDKALEPLCSALALAQKSGNAAHQAMCHKAIALVHSEAGRVDEAIKAYEQVIEIGLGNGTIWNNVGLLYLRSVRLDEALKAYNNAIQSSPSDPVSWYGLGNIHSVKGRLDEAINCYRKAIQFNAGYIAPWIQLADVLAKQDRHDDALYAYMRIVEMDKKNVRAWSEIGNIYFKAGSFNQSIDAYKKALLLGDNSPAIHKNLAYAHTQAGNYSEAIPLLTKAVEIESDSDEKAALCNTLGDVYRRVGDYDNAVASYELADRNTPLANFEHSEAVQSGKEIETPAELKVPQASEDEIKLEKPQTLEKIEAFSVSGEAFEGMTPMESLGNKQVAPDGTGTDSSAPNLENANLLSRLAAMYLKVGAIDKAIDAYEKSVSVDPTNGKTCFELGLLYSQKDELPKAVTNFEKSADLLPMNQEKAEALNLAGGIYRKLKEYAYALAAYEAAFNFDPDNKSLLDNLGKIQDDLDQLIKPGAMSKDAQPGDVVGSTLVTLKEIKPSKINQKDATSSSEAGKQPVKIDLTNPDVWNELGNIYVRSNAYDEAVEAYQKAIALNPEFGWSYGNLALVYIYQGRYDEAVNLLEKSVELLWTDKDKALVWNRIGDIFRQVGQYPKAVTSYQNADRLLHDQVSVSSVQNANFEHLFSHFIS